MGEAKRKGTPKMDEEVAAEELEHLLTTMSKSIVDHPEELVVHPARGRGFVAFEVHCDPEDAGTLIGRKGMHADAMRTMLNAAAAVRKIRVSVQFVGRDDGVIGGNR